MQESDIRTKEIASAIVQACIKADEPQYGSQLGVVVRPLMPATEFKRAYGTLREFIATHCPEIKRVGARGGNDIFALAGMTLKSISKFESRPKEHPNEFWKTFSSPLSKGHLFVNPSSGALHLAPDENDQPPGFVLLRKISESEQRDYMREFLESVHDSEREQFLSALEAPSYWKAWQEVLKSEGANDYSRIWEAFRLSKVSEIFKLRLQEQEVPESLHSHCLNQLKTPVLQTPSTAISKTNEELVRMVIAHAGRAMPLDRLREIELPLGVVIDALVKHLR